jgi:transposase
MAPYSVDLRKRVLAAWDASGDAVAVAAQFSVSRAWVHRVVQRRRDSGEVAPRRQTRWRTPVLAGREAELQRLVAARPDRTLVELRAALHTSAALSTIWLMLNRLGLTVKKNGTRRRAAAPRRRRRTG